MKPREIGLVRGHGSVLLSQHMGGALFIACIRL